MTPQSAEEVALDALGWIASDPGEARAFLAETGAAPGDLRARVGDPALLVAALDFVLGSDARVRAFAAATGRPADAPARAAAALPGGAAPHWT